MISLSILQMRTTAKHTVYRFLRADSRPLLPVRRTWNLRPEETRSHELIATYRKPRKPRDRRGVVIILNVRP